MSARAKTTATFINLESPSRCQTYLQNPSMNIYLCVPHFSSCTTFRRQTGLFVRRESSLLSSFAPPITGICVIIPRCCNPPLTSGRAALNHDKLSCSPGWWTAVRFFWANANEVMSNWGVGDRWAPHLEMCIREWCCYRVTPVYRNILKASVWVDGFGSPPTSGFLGWSDVEGCDVVKM